MLLVALTLSLCLARDDRAPLLVGVSSLCRTTEASCWSCAPRQSCIARSRSSGHASTCARNAASAAHVAAKSRRPALTTRQPRVPHNERADRRGACGAVEAVRLVHPGDRRLEPRSARRRVPRARDLAPRAQDLGDVAHADRTFLLLLPLDLPLGRRRCDGQAGEERGGGMARSGSTRAPHARARPQLT